ncbi:MAG: Metal-dependent phosphohydrolase [Candidatus Roizmanbacteria bacterium GW2011_GWC2_37_13]|uniref:5'-deoxynucleotidase n=1 Tax=Candidatus Roizmanbacteria bacterium GW2011_GWC2_37_13 TaxID=1618486 RepID=A0A0G0ILK8_9BACT|nr:MAG: Metal-dependent phosphohydrolase [Candidatus Roizmanbacteria bacterium GW2011_GWC1_37_12]KKQ25084.1 MAG: Metal-dependent phosphohydrolase [Candidatus Roizmanbacteria bacterium GW2011_GWC2_37_13]
MNKVSEPESVADHCFRVIVLAMALSKSLDVNQEKLIKMAIIHDLGETSTGDIVIQRGAKVNLKKRKKKEKIEKEAIRTILFGYGEDYAKLFHEMIERKTKEAIIFWEIDILERTIQAYEYEKEQGKDLSEFFESAEAHIKTPLLKQTIKDLQKMRR